MSGWALLAGFPDQEATAGVALSSVTAALLIIDLQNDFIPGGALAVGHGDEVIGPINELASSRRFGVVVATRDWHPANHASFVEQGGPWPVHCVQDTPGAELVSALDRKAIDAVVNTGVGRDDDGYSAFETGELGNLLRAKQVDGVTVVGLATDFCVFHTARDALRMGYRVTVPTWAVRGIDPAGSDAALTELREAGAEIV
ncbi:MAG TPA: nicotinamidase [Conexibacter sp.]|jgi:nicotinamidase/pyrazinamidase